MAGCASPPPLSLAAHLGDYLEGVTLVVVEGYEIDLGLVAARDHAAIAEEENVSIFALLVMQTTFGRRGRRARSQTDHLMPLQLPSWASAGSCRVVCTCPSHGTISDQLRASSVVSDEEGAQRLSLAR